MKLSRRETTTDTDVVEPETAETVNLGKGRATPKRRDAQGKRGPVSAPRTRKEAIARQRQLVKEQKVASKAPVKARSVAEQRAALKRGDADALPRRDQGPTRKIARDYVDSKRMISNYLLWLFPIMLLPIVVSALAGLQALVLVALVVLLIEWYIVGKRIRALAVERHGKADGGPMTIGFYAGSRAYLPRRWRLPAPQVVRGEEF